MIKSLILKELNVTSIGSKLKKENILNTMLEVILYGGFIAIEVYLFHMLIKKLEAYSNVPEAFLTIYLTIISFIITLILTIQARKSIFSLTDAKVMLTKPIRPRDNIISKIVFIYIKDVLFNFFVAFPILVSYSMNLHLPGYVIIFCVLYPFLMALIETGVACIFVLGFQKIHQLLQRYVILQIIFSIVIIVLFC